MDFDHCNRFEGFREEVKEFFREHCTADLLQRVRTTGTIHDWTLHRAMASRNWLMPTWPVAEGGCGWDPMQEAIFREEAARAGAPLDGVSTTTYVAETLRALGTEEQRAVFLPALLAGDAITALGFTEPDAGSDVASARTRATPVGSRWRIDGQKMFTTLAHEASWVFLLARTNTESKHGGLTMFLVPLDADGVEIQPVHTLGGERTNVTFYNEVMVPDSHRIGAVDGGWAVLSHALSIEHGISFAGDCLRLLDSALATLTTVSSPEDTPLVDDPYVRLRIGAAAVEAEVARLLAYRAAWMVSRGDAPVAEGPMTKLYSSESFVRQASAMVDIFGAHGIIGASGDVASTGGEVEHAFRHSVVTTIYGGTSEVQRGIIAAERLGLSGRRARQGAR